MARPRKLEDADAIRLVDSLYEQCGDHSRLKFSELEKHAALLGMDVKAYDLRRHNVVLRRIAEIEALELNSYSLEALAYKGLDIDGFVSNNRTPDKMKQSLSELDGRWRKLFDQAVSLSEQVSVLSGRLQKSEALADGLKEKNAELMEDAAAGRNAATALKVENTYLRRMVREYLYPSLADSILKPGHSASASVVTPAAVLDMIDREVPLPFSMSIEPDRKLRSREEALLDRLRLEAMDDF
ncbi:MAG: hypothetical protein FWD43_05170 [Coriobacteriia bacterium]|nr:hypothetical protein [Coriobacteriia bacterium]